MKTVTANETEKDESNNPQIELMMRQCAREVIAKVFPNVHPDVQLIEEVTREIVVTNEDGLLIEEDIKEEIANLIVARGWAKKAYGDDGPSATITAYRVLFGTTNEVRWDDLIEQLDDLEEKVEDLGKRRR